MSYQIIPNVVFICSVLGILLIILRHLPDAANKTLEESNLEHSVERKLLLKGLPIEAISKLKALLKLWTKKLWNFVLEAKDLKPTAVAGYKIRKMFRQKSPASSGTVSENIQTPRNSKTMPNPPEVKKDERYFLANIKQDPKNLKNYDALGKYYIDSKNYPDAKDIYIYLTSHEPGNSDYRARLASCYFHTQMYASASIHYQKSIALDSTQPNRYYNLGLSLHAERQYKGAIQNFEKAIALEPENSKYYIGLSNTLLKLEEFSKAKAALLQGQQLDPENKNIQAKIKQLPQEVGK